MSYGKRPGIHVWRPDGLPGLEMMRGVSLTQAQDQPKHAQAEYEICAIEQGTGELFCGGSWNSHGPGGLAVVPPGRVHAGRGSAVGLTLRMATLSPALVQSAGLAQTGILTAGLFADAALARRFLRLHHRIMAEDIPSLEAEARLLLFLGLLLRRFGCLEAAAPRRERQAVARARDFLEDNYREDITLHRLAEIAGLSTYHFHRVFQQEMGLPPHTFLRHVRLYRAKEMLARGVPAGRAAVEVGFFDQAHFTRHFKRLVGITPGQYAQNHNSQNRNSVLFSPYPSKPYSSLSI